ncbi:cytochrome P450 [Nemania sp. FL0031]|nr:cytochrome P450 [Nemania sp. FL0031]
MLPLMVIVAIGLALFLYVGYRWALPKPLPGIPYNVEATKNLLGDAPALRREASKTGDLVAWFLKQNQKAGSPISQIFLQPLGGPYVLVSDWRTARDVMLHRTREFDRSSLMYTYFEGLLGRQHFILKTGPEWKLHRRVVDDTMSPAFLNKMASHTIYARSLDWVELWDNKARLASGRPFKANHDIHYAVLDTVLGFSFGSQFPRSATKPQIQRLARITPEDFGHLPATLANTKSNTVINFPEDPIDEGLRSMLELLETLEEVKTAPSVALKWWFVKKTSTYQYRTRMKDECIRAEIKKSVDARNIQDQNSIEVDENPSWMRCAVAIIVDREARNAKREGRAPDFFSKVVMEEIWGFIVAGSDTMSTTLSWGVKFLADNPRAQDRLRKALQTAHSKAIAETRLPSVEEIIQTPVPYLDAAMEEILRCGGTIPIGDREAIVDTVLLGHHIPKGTKVRFLHNGPGIRRPELEVNEKKYEKDSNETEKAIPGWDSEDVDLFKPERWLSGSKSVSDDDDTEWANLAFDPQAGPSIPFGLGIRGCFGRRLAYVEFRILLTMVIWNFELLRCPDELSSYAGQLAFVHKPRNCFVRLRKINY